MIVPDFDPDEIDPGIRALVLALRLEGFETCDSGDGQSKPADWYATGEALPFPHVACIVPPLPERANGMSVHDATVVRELYAIRAVAESHRLLAALERMQPSTWQVELSYDPSDGLALLMVTEAKHGTA